MDTTIRIDDLITNADVETIGKKVGKSARDGGTDKLTVETKDEIRSIFGNPAKIKAQLRA